MQHLWPLLLIFSKDKKENGAKMKNKEMKIENKRLLNALAVANKTILLQMQEIKELNNICELNDKFHKQEIFKLQSIVEYLESKI